MPLYCYRTEDGQHSFERYFPLTKEKNVPPLMIEEDGKVFYHDVAGDHRDTLQLPGNWPMVGELCGVHPDQIPAARELDRQHGVPTDYTREGDPIFRGPDHYAKWKYAHGYFDRNAYGVRGEASRRHRYRDLPPEE